MKTSYLNLNFFTRLMKRFFTRVSAFAIAAMSAFSIANAQAPANAPDVMLQGFHWDSYGDGQMDKSYSRTKWSDLMSQVDEIAESFDLVWLPPSAQQEGGGGTGYHPIQWSNQNSSWGSALELKNLIAAFKERGTRAVADIVINHKAGSGWISFYQENFNGQTFQFNASHICRDDEASKKGYNPTGNNDAGYETLNCDGASASGAYCAARDLDHSNSYVREAIKAYLGWMKGTMGYDGWRYDLVKGYLGKYTQEYNNSAGAYMSVGEYWDGSYDAVVNWINATGKSSMAFDFPGKYSINNFGGSNLDALVNGYGTWTGISGADEYCRYAVTFVDNHDTFRDGYNKYNGDWTKANAFILAGPGIPCVFWPHWEKCKDDIKAMIRARKACGIHSQSKAGVVKKGSYIEGTTEGTNGTLKMFIGSGWSQPAGYQLACSGDGWAYYTNVSVPVGPTLAMSPNGGYVGQGGKVTLTASGTNVTIYYTTNGSAPSATSTKYTGPISITSDGTQIRAIAIDGEGNRSSEVSGTFYTVRPDGYTIKVKGQPTTWGNNVYIYAFNPAVSQAIGKEWPGEQMTLGSDGFYSYTVATDISPIGLVFSCGKGNSETEGLNQTVDVLGVTGDMCYEISSNYDGNQKYAVNTTSCPATAVDETEAVNVAVWPNPATDAVNVIADKAISKITVINLAGGIEFATDGSQVNIGGLAPSLYFLEISFEDGSKIVEKILKK